MANIFYLPKEEYESTLDPLNSFIEQAGKYMSVLNNIPIEEAKEKAKDILKNNFKDKKIIYFHRKENGDREVIEGSLIEYIISAIKEKRIIAPTFTTYLPPEEKKSILSEFIFENVKKRSKSKKEAHKAKAEGNMLIYEAKNNEQNMMKIYNNSLSGAFAQEACILHNPTGHSTLTSITRTITSLANANNEKLIMGNRYYPRGIDVLNNIVYIVTYADISQIKSTIEEFKLYLPTVEDVVQVLKYSSELYFSDNNFYESKIIPFLRKLDPYELAAICYIGDLYHIRYFNEGFIRTLLSKLITKVESKGKIGGVVEKLRNYDDYIINLVHGIFFKEVRGYGKDYEKMNETNLASSMYLTALNIENVVEEYKSFFITFFRSKILPGNSFRLNYMLRRTVVLSDTDSTCITFDNWIKWWNNGNYVFNDESIAIACALNFIASSCITHLLRMVSKNMNISTDNLDVLSMKNEFLWGYHLPTVVSKHYLAYTFMQEGNVLYKQEMEIKGVHLKNSAVPKYLLKDAHDIVTNIFNTLMENKKVNLHSIISKIKYIENEIYNNIAKGSSLYLKRSKIKQPESYAVEGNNPYTYHLLWLKVFREKYGTISDPPYDAIKIPTVITTKTKLMEYIDSMDDIKLKNRLVNWLKENKKTSLPTILINVDYVEAFGIPDEILRVIDYRRVILDVTIQHRLILKSLGVMIDEDLLISEQFK